MNYMRKTILFVIAMLILAIAPMSLKADNPNKILIAYFISVGVATLRR